MSTGQLSSGGKGSLKGGKGTLAAAGTPCCCAGGCLPACSPNDGTQPVLVTLGGFAGNLSACPDCYDFDLGQLNGTYCLPATGDAANPCVWGLTLDMGVVVRPATCTASPGTFPARVTIGFRVTGGFPDALVGVVVAYDLGDGSYRGGVAMFFENGSDILDSHTCPRSATYTHAHNPAEACSSIDGTATVDLGAVC